MLPWVPNRNDPWTEGIREELGLKRSSWTPCWDDSGVGWLRCMGPPRFRDPVPDHIEA